MRVIENALPKSLFYYILHNVKREPYIFVENTSFFGEDASSPLNSSWAQVLFDKYQGGILSPSFYNVQAALMVAFENCNEEIRDLIRVRVGLITAQPSTFTHLPHVDYDYPHKTCLLYLTDSDGDTTIYDEKYDNNQVLSSYDFYTQHYKNGAMGVAFKSTPEANKMIIFDGLHYHCSSTPTSVAARIAININYI